MEKKLAADLRISACIWALSPPGRRHSYFLRRFARFSPLGKHIIFGGAGENNHQVAVPFSTGQLTPIF